MIYKKQKGFTLLELLIVIAMIGLLSAIVSVAINSARVKSRNSSVISQMNSMHAQSELYYLANNGKYSTNGTDPSGMCGASPAGGNSNVFQFGTNNMSRLLSNAQTNLGAQFDPSNSMCNANATAWVVAISLPGGGVYCVDSTRRSSNKTIGGVLYTNIASAVTSSGTFVCL